MIDPIRNQAYQEYNANKIPPKSSAAEAGTEKFSLDYSDEGVLYEPSEKEADSKADSAASKKQSGSFRQAALLELSSLSEERNETARPNETPAAHSSLTDTLRRFLTRAAQTLKKLWTVVWESKAADSEPLSSQEAAEEIPPASAADGALDMTQDDAAPGTAENSGSLGMAENGTAPGTAENSGSLGMAENGAVPGTAENSGSLDMAESGAVPDTGSLRDASGALQRAGAKDGSSFLHAKNDPGILHALKSGDSQGFRSLLSEDGRRTPARSSSLLTYYDSKGNLISPDASVQQRILHGDRGSIKR